MRIRRVYDGIHGGASVFIREGDCVTCPAAITMRINSVCKIKEWAEGIYEVGATNSVGQIEGDDICRGFDKSDTMYGVATLPLFNSYVYLVAVGLISDVVSDKTKDMYIVSIGEILDSVSDIYHYKLSIESTGQITEQVADGVLYWDVGFIKRGPHVGSWEKE